MYKVAIQPILTNGCSALSVSLCVIDRLDKYQAKLIKYRRLVYPNVAATPLYIKL